MEPAAGIVSRCGSRRTAGVLLSPDWRLGALFLKRGARCACCGAEGAPLPVPLIPLPIGAPLGDMSRLGAPLEASLHPTGIQTDPQHIKQDIALRLGQLVTCQGWTKPHAQPMVRKKWEEHSFGAHKVPTRDQHTMKDASYHTEAPT